MSEFLPEHNLYRSSYPNNLRVDNKSDTYVDNEGHIYLYPNELHDFQLTKKLIDNGLSVAKIVDYNHNNLPNGPNDLLIQYSSDNNFIPLAYILNASIRTPDLYDDITQSFRLIKKFLDQLEKNNINIRLSDINISTFTINKNDSSVEIIPPYQASEGPISAKKYFSTLKEDILNHCNSQQEQNTINQLTAQI